MIEIKARKSFSSLVFAVGAVLVGLLVIGQPVVAGENGGKGVEVQAVEKRGVRIWTEKGCGSSYRLDELLNVKVKAERSGYLTIFDLMPNGGVQILFPNRFQGDNYIQAGKVYQLPATGDPFQLRISRPRGLDQLLAVVTEAEKKLVREDFSRYSGSFPKLQDSKGEVVRQVKKGVEVIPDRNWWAADSCSFYVGDSSEYQTQQPGVGVDQDDQTEDHQEQATEKLDGRVLIVGIADYVNMEFEHLGRVYRFKDLSYSVNDAKDMKRFLKTRYSKVKTLLDEEATYKNIRKNVRNWLGAAGKDEIAVLYFSGHGAFQSDMNGDEDDGLDEVLVPYNYAKTEKFIVDDRLNDWLTGLRARRVVYIADSCHSGTSSKAVRTFTTPSGTKSAGGEILGDSIGSDLTDREGANLKGGSRAGIVALEAAKPSQNAVEDKDLKQGVFTHFLLKGMKGSADENGNNKITPEELFDFSKQKVMKYTDDRQEPICSGCTESKIYISIAE